MKTRITALAFAVLAVSTFVYSQSSVISNPAKSINNLPGKTSSYTEGEYYVEGFEWGGFPPDKWKAINVEGAYTWDSHLWDYNVYEGEKCAYVNYQITTCMIESSARGIKSILKTECSNYSIATKENDWLITPRYLAGQDDSLIFYASPYYFQGDTNRLSVRASLSETIPADSSKIDAFFDITLLDIDITTAGEDWRRYSIPLGKYSGQKIYIGFNNYCVNGTGILLDDIRLGKQPANDISTAAFEINRFYRTEDKIAAKATFVNYGKAAQNFYAVCEIPQEAYKNEKFIENIACDSVITVQFDSLLIENGQIHDAVFYTRLDGDENISNDTLKGEFYAVEKLSSSFWHLEPDLNRGHWLNGAASYIKESGNESLPDTSLVYIIGGIHKNLGCLDSVYIYNAYTRRWNEAGFILPKKLSQIIPVQVGGKIYIPGGYDYDINSLSTNLYIYDIKENKITEGAQLLSAFYYYSAGVYCDSLIYLFSGGSNTDNVQIYNIHDNTWKYGTPCPMPFSLGSLAGDKIVTTGWNGNVGYTSIGSIDKNDPYQIKWSITEYPGSRFGERTTGSWNGKKNKYVFFAGGQLSFTYSTEVWVYDVINEKWFYAPNKINASCFQDNIVPVIRNDSVFMIAGGGRGEYDFSSSNEWLFIGIDEPETYIGTDDEPNYPAPNAYSLSQNYPNPFNPSTKIKYSLCDPEYVKLTVYDMLGREIKTLINEFKNAGEHEVIFNAAELNLSSGIYLYRIKAGSFVQTKKFMLLK